MLTPTSLQRSHRRRRTAAGAGGRAPRCSEKACETEVLPQAQIRRAQIRAQTQKGEDETELVGFDVRCRSLDPQGDPEAPRAEAEGARDVPMLPVRLDERRRAAPRA